MVIGNFYISIWTDAYKNCSMKIVYDIVYNKIFLCCDFLR